MIRVREAPTGRELKRARDLVRAINAASEPEWGYRSFKTVSWRMLRNIPGADEYSLMRCISAIEQEMV